MTESTEGVKRDALLALEKRVAEANEGSRELDWAVARTFNLEKEPSSFGPSSSFNYTSNINAATALAVHAGDGHRVFVNIEFDSEALAKAEVLIFNHGDCGPPTRAIALKPAAAHAIILALLRSLTKGAGG